MKKKFSILFLFLQLIIFSFSFPALAQDSSSVDKAKQAIQGIQQFGPDAAPTTGGTDIPKIPITQPKGAFSSVSQIFSIIFNLVIYGSGIAFLILFLIGGLQYLTSAGNEEQAGKAKKLLLDAIIGLIIVLGSWAIGTFILGRFGISV